MHAGSVARALLAGGFDVVAACDSPDLRGRADDELLVAAASQQRASVTQNVRDFAPLADSWSRSGRAHSGIVFTSPGRFNRAAKAYPGDLIAALQEFLTNPPIESESWVWWL